MPHLPQLLIMPLLLLTISSCAKKPELPRTTKTFDGQSDNLKATKVVPTLGTTFGDNQNAIWCASFLSAWKLLSKDMSKGNVSLQGSPQTAMLLNTAPDATPHIPPSTMYVVAGWTGSGVIERIHRELKAVFPGKTTPTFPDVAPESFVAYSYLEASIKFDFPYFQNRQPLGFCDSKGRLTDVASFGIRSEDDYAYWELRRQSRILFRKGAPNHSDFEFAVDLCTTSSPSQIILARIAREQTLAQALVRLDMELSESEKLKQTDPIVAKYQETIGPNDVLLVPDFFWQVSHRFSELEGRQFLNAPMMGMRLDVAQQDILFRLDRTGAELKSESKMFCKPTPTYFVFDRPFLICMKKRGEPEPYFAMWVDNAELLTPWHM